MKLSSPTLARAYVQSRRAEAAAETGVRIEAAATAVFFELGGLPTLDAVAARAGVTVQTVLRRYGSKERLFATCVERGAREVETQRGSVVPGDLGGAIDNLVAHYDEWGERSLSVLRLERESAASRAVATRGRAVHAAWVAAAFGPCLSALRGKARARRLAQLVAVTDVHVWKLLHIDQGLDRQETRAALLDLVLCLVGSRTAVAR